MEHGWTPPVLLALSTLASSAREGQSCPRPPPPSVGGSSCRVSPLSFWLCNACGLVRCWTHAACGTRNTWCAAEPAASSVCVWGGSWGGRDPAWGGPGGGGGARAQWKLLVSSPSWGWRREGMVPGAGWPPSPPWRPSPDYNSQHAPRPPRPTSQDGKRRLAGSVEPIGGRLVGPGPGRSEGRRQDGSGEHHGVVSGRAGPRRGLLSPPPSPSAPQSPPSPWGRPGPPRLSLSHPGRRRGRARPGPGRRGLGGWGRTGWGENWGGGRRLGRAMGGEGGLSWGGVRVAAKVFGARGEVGGGGKGARLG